MLACNARSELRYDISTTLYEFYTFCAARSVPEIRQPAETISTRQEPMIPAIQTDPSNARSEGFNQIRQTRRPHRVRLQNTREPTPPTTAGLHRQSQRAPSNTRQLRPHQLGRARNLISFQLPLKA